MGQFDSILRRFEAAPASATTNTTSGSASCPPFGVFQRGKCRRRRGRGRYAAEGLLERNRDPLTADLAALVRSPHNGENKLSKSIVKTNIFEHYMVSLTADLAALVCSPPFPPGQNQCFSHCTLYFDHCSAPLHPSCILPCIPPASHDGQYFALIILYFDHFPVRVTADLAALMRLHPSSPTPPVPTIDKHDFDHYPDRRFDHYLRPPVEPNRSNRWRRPGPPSSRASSATRTTTTRTPPPPPPPAAAARGAPPPSCRHGRPGPQRRHGSQSGSDSGKGAREERREG